MIVTCLITVYVFVGNNISGEIKEVRGVYIKQNTNSMKWLVNFETDLKKQGYGLSINDGTQWVQHNMCEKESE
jgi:hypothetical protein